MFPPDTDYTGGKMVFELRKTKPVVVNDKKIKNFERCERNSNLAAQFANDANSMRHLVFYRRKFWKH